MSHHKPIIYKHQDEKPMKSLEKIIQDGIAHGQAMALEYQGNSRRIIPLVHGLLKNGKEAVLCYKINSVDADGPDLAIRLYHSHKITNPQLTGEAFPFSRKIDYYLTKHFRTVYTKV